MMPSTRFSAIATSLPAPSTRRILTLSPSTPLAFHSAGSSARPASAGAEAMVLPSKSLSVCYGEAHSSQSCEEI